MIKVGDPRLAGWLAHLPAGTIFGAQIRFRGASRRASKLGDEDSKAREEGEMIKPGPSTSQSFVNWADDHGHKLEKVLSRFRSCQMRSIIQITANMCPAAVADPVCRAMAFVLGLPPRRLWGSRALPRACLAGQGDREVETPPFPRPEFRNFQGAPDFLWKTKKPAKNSPAAMLTDSSFASQDNFIAASKERDLDLAG